MYFCDAIIRGLVQSLGLIGGILSIIVVILCFIVGVTISILYFLLVTCWFIGIPLIAIVAAYNWETFAYWYFSLTPHPAASMVRDAIRSGVEIDERAFTDILRDPPLSKVGRDVRNEQAAKLAEMARMSNAELLRKEAQLRRRMEEEAKYQAAQSDLMDAVIEQQLAKARADAYAKAEEFWRSRRKT
jgi:hypothetical protein